MHFMNEWDIEAKVREHRYHPVLGPATQFLHDFMREVSSHSDGWAYWPPPVRAASKLMTLIEEAKDTTTLDDVRRALSPIKAFMTRRGYQAGMKLPQLYTEVQQRLV
jgi:hypothetical protein